MLLPAQTEQMKSPMRNEGPYQILASWVRILSKTPAETAAAANLCRASVWSSPCKWSAPIKKIRFPVSSVFISVKCLEGTQEEEKKRHSPLPLPRIFQNKQFAAPCVRAQNDFTEGDSILHNRRTNNKQENISSDATVTNDERPRAERVVGAVWLEEKEENIYHRY